MHLHHQAAAGQAVIMQPHPHHPPQVWSVIKKLLLFWSLSLKVQGLFVRTAERTCSREMGMRSSVVKKRQENEKLSSCHTWTSPVCAPPPPCSYSPADSCHAASPTTSTATRNGSTPTIKFGATSTSTAAGTYANCSPTHFSSLLLLLALK